MLDLWTFLLHLCVFSAKFNGFYRARLVENSCSTVFCVLLHSKSYQMMSANQVNLSRKNDILGQN